MPRNVNSRGRTPEDPGQGDSLSTRPQAVPEPFLAPTSVPSPVPILPNPPRSPRILPLEAIRTRIMNALNEYGGLITKDVWRHCRLLPMKCGDVYQIMDRMMLEGHLSKTEEGEESFWRPAGMPADHPRRNPFEVTLKLADPYCVNEHEVALKSGGRRIQTIRVTPGEAQILIKALEPLAYPKTLELWPETSSEQTVKREDPTWI